MSSTRLRHGHAEGFPVHLDGGFISSRASAKDYIPYTNAEIDKSEIRSGRTTIGKRLSRQGQGYVILQHGPSVAIFLESLKPCPPARAYFGHSRVLMRQFQRLLKRVWFSVKGNPAPDGAETATPKRLRGCFES